MNRIRQPIPIRLRQYIMRRDGGRCVLCGDDGILHLDHIIPFSKGGQDTEENLRVLCRKCNLEKGVNDLHPTEEEVDDEWMGDDLRNSVIFWAPTGRGTTFDGAVRLVQLGFDPGLEYFYSWGGCNSYIAELNFQERQKELFQRFIELVVYYGINPKLLHRTLMPLREYRVGLVAGGWPDWMQGIPRYRA